MTTCSLFVPANGLTMTKPTDMMSTLQLLTLGRDEHLMSVRIDAADQETQLVTFSINVAKGEHRTIVVHSSRIIWITVQ